MGIPRSENPTMDSTGDKAYVGQVYPHVLFLCQTFEKSGYVPIRDVTIPKGMSVFMPIINWISTKPEDGETDDDLIKKAKIRMDGAQDLKIVMNGFEIREQFQQYRARSNPFDVELPDDNVLNVNMGLKRLVSDGYWIFTKPLSSPLSISTYGTCTSGATKIGAIYNIRIADP